MKALGLRTFLWRSTGRSVWRFECRKLFHMPALYILLALCLLINGVIFFADGYERDEINALSRTLKTQEMKNERDIFEDYDAGGIGALVIRAMELQGVTAELVREKYATLQPQVDALAASDAALDYYAGPYTYKLHEKLFCGVFRLVVGEGVLLAAFLMLFSLGYEQKSHTQALVYTARRGRRIVRDKLLAAGLVSLLSYAVLCAGSFAVYFSLWDYSGFFQSSISSANNYLPAWGVALPIIPWAPFTVGGYFWSMLSCSVLLVLCFFLLSAVCGLLTKNLYTAFVGEAFLCFLLFFLSQQSYMQSGGLICFVLGLSPTMLWFYLPMWFTEASGCSLFPWYELTGVAVNFILLTALLCAALHRFYRKDVRE